MIDLPNLTGDDDDGLAWFHADTAEREKATADWLAKTREDAERFWEAFGRRDFLVLDNRHGQRLVIHPSSYRDYIGQFQMSWLNPDGEPWGHDNHKTMEDAILSASGAAGAMSQGMPGEYTVTTEGVM